MYEQKHPIRGHPRARQAPRHGGTFSLGRLFGFPLRVHWSWLVAFVLVAWTLQAGIIPGAFPEWNTSARWLAGAGVSLIFFGSVLLHELAHALVARRRGYAVHGITLFVFGGVSELAEEPRTARDEFWIALVGPLMSLALALAFGVGAVAGAWLGLGAATMLAVYLAFVNFMLGAFNLLPGFPLDGGRVFRAFLWWRGRGHARATRTAVTAGRIVAGGLMALGVLVAVTSGFFNGFWLLLVGWYLWSVAGAAGQETLRETLATIPAMELAERDVPRVAPDLSLRRFVNEEMLPRNRRAFFVSPCEDCDVLGLITVTDVRRVPEPTWDTVSVYRAMTPLDRLMVAEPRTDALTALELMTAQNLDHLPVFQGRNVLGLLSRAGVLRALHLRAGLGRPAA